MRGVLLAFDVHKISARGERRVKRQEEVSRSVLVYLFLWRWCDLCHKWLSWRQFLWWRNLLSQLSQYKASAYFIKWKIHLNNFFYKNKFFSPFRIFWIKQQQTTTMERSRMAVEPIIRDIEYMMIMTTTTMVRWNLYAIAMENDWNNVFHEDSFILFYFYQIVLCWSPLKFVWHNLKEILGLTISRLVHGMG